MKHKERTSLGWRSLDINFGPTKMHASAESTLIDKQYKVVQAFKRVMRRRKVYLEIFQIILEMTQMCQSDCMDLNMYIT